MGSENKNNSGHAASAGNNAKIPSPLKKVIHNIREVISGQYNDFEIYAALRVCDMDPNDAVQHLLSQGPPKSSDTFHRVKSKREKKKEMKENQEVKARANSSILNRGARVGDENIGWQRSSTHSGSNGMLLVVSLSASIFLLMGFLFVVAEVDKGSLRRENDSVACLQSASSAYHTSTAGKRSNEKCSPQSGSLSSDSRGQPLGSGGTSPGIQSTWCGSSSGHASMADIVRGRPCTKASEISYETSYTAQDENSPNCFSYDMKHSHESSPPQPEMHDTQLSLNLDTSDRYGQSDEIQLLERDAAEMKNQYSGNMRSAQAFSRQEGTGRSTDKSLSNHSTSLPGDVNKAVTAATVNLQNLSLGREQSAMSPKKDNCGLVLPNYLLEFAADCSHLSFGTYTSGKNSAPSVPHTSIPLSTEVEKPFAANDSSAAVHLDSRNTTNYGDELLGDTYGTSRATAYRRNYDPSLYTERLNHHLPAAAYGQDYMHSSVPNSIFENTQQMSSATNLTAFSSELQAHSNSFANDSLAVKARGSTVFHETQSMPLRYSNQSLNPSNISMSEVLNSGSFSMPQPSSLSLAGASLPLKPGQSFSEFGYGMPETYGFTSAFPQSRVDSGYGSYGHPSGMEYNPRQRSAIPRSSFPRSSSNVPAYGSLQNSDGLYQNLVRDFSMVKTGKKVGNDGNNFTPYLENDGPGNWRGSTTLETPGYNFPEQGQLRSQHQDSLWNPSVYGSQLNTTPEQQQSFSYLAQRIPSKQVRQPPHIWRPNY